MKVYVPLDKLIDIDAVVIPSPLIRPVEQFVAESLSSSSSSFLHHHHEEPHVLVAKRHDGNRIAVAAAAAAAAAVTVKVVAVWCIVLAAVVIGVTVLAASSLTSSSFHSNPPAAATTAITQDRPFLQTFRAFDSDTEVFEGVASYFATTSSTSALSSGVEATYGPIQDYSMYRKRAMQQQQ